MSGGSWDYAYRDVAELADRLLADRDPLRHAFGFHLAKVSEALRAIEWVDSADLGAGDEADAIRACLAPDAEVRALEADLRAIMARAAQLLGRLRGPA